jgi:hypothetical protein
MNQEIYQYRFADHISIQDIEETLMLAVIATEALHGRTRVNLDAEFHLDKKKRTCEVSTGTDVGKDIARLFAGFLTREFGEDAFEVKRIVKSGLERIKQHANA